MSNVKKTNNLVIGNEILDLVDDEARDLINGLQTELSTAETEISAIDERIDEVLPDVTGAEVVTLWTGSISKVGDSATLSADVSDFDFIDIYMLSGTDTKFYRIPKTQTTLQIQSQNMSDDASSNFLRLWETGISISGTTVSINKVIAWAWDNPNSGHPTVTANATNGDAITRIDGVKTSQSVNAELQDIRIGADGINYNAAGTAVRKQINNLKSGLNNEIANRKSDANTLQTYKVNRPVDSYGNVTNGSNGQFLRTKGDGSTEWAEKEAPTDEQVTEAVEAWLDDHPEATTTVQDGSVTEAKLSDALKLKTINDYVTPQMFGAKGDGITDDTDAIQSCIDDCYANGRYRVFFPKGTYLVTRPIVIYFSYQDFWYGKGITLEGEHKGDTIIVKQGIEQHKGVDTVLYCACGDDSSKNDGSGVSVFNLRIENKSETKESYCINGDNYARGEFKRLTLVGNYGIKCNGYSNVYDDIIGFTQETFFEDAGTSNLIGKIGCFGAHNPYKLHGVYSTYNVLFGDNCTGIFAEISAYGNCHVNSIGAESPALDCIIQAGEDSSTAQNRSVTIDNIYCFNLTTVNANYFVVKEARLKVDSISIVYQNSAVETTLCYFDGTYGTCQIGEVSPISNVYFYDANKFSLFGNMGVRNHLFINFSEFTGYIRSDGIISLGGNTSYLGVSESSKKNKWQSVVMGGYLDATGEFGEYKSQDGSSQRYAVQPPKGSLILNDLNKSNVGAAGFVSLANTDNEMYGNLISNKAPIPIMYTCTEEQVPAAAQKNGTLLFNTSTSKLEVYYNSAWIVIGG